MCIVGYIDDESDELNDYIKRLSRRDIELKVAPEGELQQIKQWIIEEHIACMIIDYRLQRKYGFVGTELFEYLNDELPGLPCIILTSYTESSASENKVVQNCIMDRSIMDSDEMDFSTFCDTLKQSTKVFSNNLNKYKQKFESLYHKKTDGSITSEEEEELMSVFRILRSYGEIDDISAELLTTKISKSIDNVLEKLDKLLEKN